jgi:NDP-4-keto-2,6-dideoxyhexose 3-C-methyltransferase
MYKQIKACRVCGNGNLPLLLDLGEQYLTGTFPLAPQPGLTKGPLRLVKCHGDGVCGLVQMEHSYDPGEMYGENYGYHSSLNASMVAHLRAKVARIRDQVVLKPGDLVVDIGSNDGTTLGFYPEGLLLVGVDPTGKKFQRFYKPHVNLIPDFFTGTLIQRAFPGRKAKVVSSFSMLYDLEDPQAFFREVAEILDEDGIWVTEQSYMPLMLARNSYDTACHEHLEYYGLRQLAWMADKAGLKIVDVEFNEINGGSFSTTLVLKSSSRVPVPQVGEILQREIDERLDTLAPYQAFATRVKNTRGQLLNFLAAAKAEGKRVYGLGASTKGNVLLQYCGLTESDIIAIGEVNPEKFGHVAPGSWIPLNDEREVLANSPDYLLVLPWHFREFFVTNPVFKGQTLVFPLPELDVVTP